MLQKETTVSDLMLDVDQAGELKAAFRRGDWTNGQIKKLCEGNILSQVRQVIEGKAEIVEIVMEKVKEVAVSLLTLVKIIATPTVARKKTSDCFIDKSQYYYRDPNLDAWLPKIQLDQPESKFSVQRLTQGATFKRAVESFLGVTGDIQTLSQALHGRGAVTTLPVIESLIERQEAGEDVGLQTNGYANFFFTENADGSVSVVDARRNVRGWNVSVCHLGNDYVWYADDRFFFRN
jgi:hypothetical protein